MAVTQLGALVPEIAVGQWELGGGGRVRVDLFYWMGGRVFANLDEDLVAGSFYI